RWRRPRYRGPGQSQVRSWISVHFQEWGRVDDFAGHQRRQQRFAEPRQTLQFVDTLAFEIGLGARRAGAWQRLFGVVQRLSELTNQLQLAFAQHALHQFADARLGFVEVPSLTGTPALFDGAPLEQLVERHADRAGAHLQLLAELRGPERGRRQVKERPHAPHWPLESPELHQSADGVGDFQFGLGHWL